MILFCVSLRERIILNSMYSYSCMVRASSFSKSASDMVSKCSKVDLVSSVRGLPRSLLLCSSSSSMMTGWDQLSRLSSSVSLMTENCFLRLAICACEEGGGSWPRLPVPFGPRFWLEKATLRDALSEKLLLLLKEEAFL